MPALWNSSSTSLSWYRSSLVAICFSLLQGQLQLWKYVWLDLLMRIWRRKLFCWHSESTSFVLLSWLATLYFHPSQRSKTCSAWSLLVYLAAVASCFRPPPRRHKSLSSSILWSSFRSQPRSYPILWHYSSQERFHSDYSSVSKGDASVWV